MRPGASTAVIVRRSKGTCFNASNKATHFSSSISRNWTFIGSAGLRTILLVAKQLKAAGGRLAVCSLSKAVKEVFDLTGVDILIDVFPSYEDAVAHLTMR
jgi:anti-anti-sigma factor